ncbi:MAG: hypothetical protein LBT33_04975 [Spirochaetia bacterium]|nr:hypothetical protein [Spirochaetia bacterium]
MRTNTKNNEKKSHILYANTVHVITIISALMSLFVPIAILLFPDANVLNPNKIFGAIFSGASPREIWEMSSTGSFPGAHFYLRHVSSPDAWAMIGINLGCSVGLCGLVPALAYQLTKERDWLEITAGALLALLILFALAGLLTIPS